MDDMIQNQLEFQAVYTEFYPKIHRYLTHLVGMSESEDLTQEVFVKISKALQDFRGESQLSNWISRIATNTAVDKKRNRAYQLAQGGFSFDGAIKTPAFDYDQLLIRDEMNQCIRSYVGGLPGNYRTVLVLSEYEGLANSNIADILGISLDAVKMRLHRARTRLKKMLEANCVFYRDERNVLACERKRCL
jgi:RNA polymerase sigma-70 factor (ECF subfamily)